MRSEDIDIRSESERETERTQLADHRRDLEDQIIQHMLSDELTTVNPIVIARGIMRETLNDDGGFRQGYVANIAMTIYDHSPGIVSDYHPSIKHCNHLAELILQKIFNDE